MIAASPESASVNGTNLLGNPERLTPDRETKMVEKDWGKAKAIRERIYGLERNAFRHVGKGSRRLDRLA